MKTFFFKYYVKWYHKFIHKKSFFSFVQLLFLLHFPMGLLLVKAVRTQHFEKKYLAVCQYSYINLLVKVGKSYYVPGSSRAVGSRFYNTTAFCHVFRIARGGAAWGSVDRRALRAKAGRNNQK